MMAKPKLIDTMEWEEIVKKIMYDSENKSPKFKTWLLSKKYFNDNFFDSDTYSNCYKIYHKINFTDDDNVEAICGIEGSGKSTVAIQKASMVDASFNRDRFFDSRLKLMEWLQDNRGKTRGKAIIIDEGNLLLFSREAMSKESVDIIKMFTLIRQANLYIIICIPSFKTIDSYLRDHRVEGLTRITHKHKSFTYYSKQAIEIVNKCMRKGLTWKEIRIPDGMFFNGYWNKDLPRINDIDFEWYVNHKDNTWKDFLSNTVERMRASSGEGVLIPISEAQKLVPRMKSDTFIKLIKEGKIEGKQIGRTYYVNKEKLLGKGV